MSTGPRRAVRQPGRRAPTLPEPGTAATPELGLTGEVSTRPDGGLKTAGKRAAKTVSTRQSKPAENAVAGVDATATTQSGSDTRKRGWFWHWNSIVTQFAPLIGLKGVGLLNSYTVWTDRREDSPNRGYAFPSQQSEADFYGEERAELITINKILVALDLIEIRKEMVVKPDAQGRQWRVPHNFYRVKDHDDGYVLNAPAVLGVVHLADRDKTVFRYLRRIFSTRFSPIDSDSVWNQIMPTLRQDPTWQRLAAKVEAEERRASDRTRAGHAARQGATATTVLFSVPAGGDSGAAIDTSNDTGLAESVVGETAPATSVAGVNEGSAGVEGVDVAVTNRGSGLDAAGSNSGSPRNRSSTVAATNGAGSTIVAPTNTMYNQSLSTTMTTTSTGISDEQPAATGRVPGTRLSRRIAARRLGPVRPVSDITADEPGVPAGAAVAADPGSGVERDGDGATRPAADGAGPDAGAAAIRAYEDANDKASTPAQRQLLTTLAAQFDAAARDGGTTGWAWVTAAIYEAVESGSAYVAPRRIRQILDRWQREGRPSGDDPDGGGRPARRTAAPTGPRRNDTAPRTGRPGTTPATAFGSGAAPIQRPTAVVAGPAPMSAASPRTGPRRVGRNAGSIDGAAATPVEGATGPAVTTVPRAASPRPAAFTVRECGLSSNQVWAAMLTELALDGDVPRADLDSAIRSAELVGRGEDGGLIIGASSAVTQRRASRYLPALRRAAEAIVGVAVPVEVAVRGPWLTEHPVRGLDETAIRGEVGTGG